MWRGDGSIPKGLNLSAQGLRLRAILGINFGGGKTLKALRAWDITFPTLHAPPLHAPNAPSPRQQLPLPLHQRLLVRVPILSQQDQHRPARDQSRIDIQ